MYQRVLQVVVTAIMDIFEEVLVMDNKRLASELLVLAKEVVAGKEYAIWGIPQGQHEDTLLVAMPNGKPITDKNEAKRIVALLEKKYGATKVRIQEIDLSGELDWMKETGLKASATKPLDADGAKRAVKEFNDALTALHDAMDFLDDFSPIPKGISAAYLNAQTHIEKIVSELKDVK